jgi:hypothetical protein
MAVVDAPWKADHNREVFSTLFTTPNAGARTDFWLRFTTVKPTADPHKKWLVLDNGAKHTFGLWRKCANVLGAARRVLACLFLVW